MSSPERGFTGLCAERLSGTDTNVHFLDGSPRNEQDEVVHEGLKLEPYDAEGCSGVGGDGKLTEM